MTDTPPPSTPADPAPPPPPAAPETPAAPSGPGLDNWEAPAVNASPAEAPAAAVPATTDSNGITERVLAKLKEDPRTGELVPAILVMVEQLAPLFAVAQEDAADAGKLNMDDVLIAMHDAVRDVRLEDDQAAVAAHHEAAGAAPFGGATAPNP